MSQDAANRAGACSPDAVRNVDLAGRGSDSKHRLDTGEKLAFPCVAFVRVADDGWLELTCPAPSDCGWVTFERRQIRVDGPADCPLLRDLRNAEGQ
jgi:hypothetical protein